MAPLLHILLVSIGAFFGAITRFLMSKLLNNGRLPWGTILVNLAGSFLLGLLYASGAGSKWLLLLGVGFMGSLTTFSTLKVEHMELTLKKNWPGLVLYSGLTYAGGLSLAWLGLHL
ncbi:MAG: CrcB family protein [Tuberibacillus sp.]